MVQLEVDHTVCAPPPASIDFAKTCQDVVHQLGRLHPRQRWLVARVTSDGLIVLQTDDADNELSVETLIRDLDVGEDVQIRREVEVVLEGHDHQDPPRWRSVVTAPIRVDEDRMWLLVGYSDEEIDRPVDDAVLIEVLANLVGRTLTAEMQRLNEQRLHRRTLEALLRDSLTNIGNRRAWEMSLDEEERRCQRFGHDAGVLVIDLDDLKEINDRKGHPAGDEVLVGAARVMMGEARKIDTVARLGGDEFGLLAPETDRAGVEALRERLQEAFDAVEIKASIGVDHRHPAVGLFGAWYTADADMYRQKNRRKAS